MSDDIEAVMAMLVDRMTQRIHDIEARRDRDMNTLLQNLGPLLDQQNPVAISAFDQMKLKQQQEAQEIAELRMDVGAIAERANDLSLALSASLAQQKEREVQIQRAAGDEIAAQLAMVLQLRKELRHHVAALETRPRRFLSDRDAKVGRIVKAMHEELAPQFDALVDNLNVMADKQAQLDRELARDQEWENKRGPQIGVQQLSVASDLERAIERDRAEDIEKKMGGPQQTPEQPQQSRHLAWNNQEGVLAPTQERSLEEMRRQGLGLPPYADLNAARYTNEKHREGLEQAARDRELGIAREASIAKTQEVAKNLGRGRRRSR